MTTFTFSPLPSPHPLLIPPDPPPSHHLLTGRVLREVSLAEPIRYASGDAVEEWLNNLLCLDTASVRRVTTGCPAPQDCDLYPAAHPAQHILPTHSILLATALLYSALPSHL